MEDATQSSLCVNGLPVSQSPDRSPTRQPQSCEIVSPRPGLSQEGCGKIDLPSPSPSTGPNTEEKLNHHQRQQELAGDQGQDSKEWAVDRRQEIEMRIRELEEDHNHSFNSRDSGSVSPPNDGPGVQPQASSPTHAISRVRYSYSTTQLVSPTSPSPPSSFPNHPYAQSQSQSPSRSQVSNLDHAAFCGCATCSASKYKTRSVTPTPYDLRPPEPPISLRPEKPKGWIRRITVPVGHAFSLDSKKSSMLKNGIMLSAAAGEEKERRRRSYEPEQGGISNHSVLNFGRR